MKKFDIETLRAHVAALTKEHRRLDRILERNGPKAEYNAAWRASRKIEKEVEKIERIVRRFPCL